MSKVSSSQSVVCLFILLKVYFTKQNFFLLIQTFRTINFLLSTSLSAFEFWYVVSSLSIISRYFLISILISSLISFILISRQLRMDGFSFLLLIYSLVPLWLENIVWIISIFWNVLSFFHGPVYSQFWYCMFIWKDEFWVPRSNLLRKYH